MITKPLNIALCPMGIVWGNKAANLDTLIELMPQLHPDTDLLVLPEMFSTGFMTDSDKEKLRCHAERNTGKTIDTIKALARTYNIAVAGSFMADSGGLLFNRAFFIEPNGDETFADKRHLFTMAGEDKVFSHGNTRMAVRYRGWNIAMIVCYDLRFPVWCRNRNNEYDLLIAVANWPVARVAAWDSLLVARALENEAYVAGVNCRGVDDKGFEYNGSSKLLDFKGKEIGKPSEAVGVIYGQLDYDRLTSFRSKFPAWKDADQFTLTIE